ncbi:hypothetical protein QTN53_14020 [Levilactobacillus brevis]|uniref:hypothetical protein n=1 Tax=Levilactobacillus brevis TaxID=1580 RepID=UPI0025A50BC3|nr:hypothetical protein [Levilactobacillus brevis]MDM5047876.1 hypothetical protein [Levilactobacillus brevis]
MNNHEMLEQILAAYQNDEINWSKVPAISALIQREVNQQVAKQVDNLANQTSQQYTDHLNTLIQTNQQKFDRNQQGLNSLNRAIDSAKQELEPTKRQKTIVLLAQVIGIVALVVTTLALFCLIMPMLFHLSGVGPIWHVLSPSLSFWGVFKAIVAILLIFVLVVLEIVVVSAPSLIVFIVISRFNDLREPYKNHYRQL